MSLAALTAIWKDPPCGRGELLCLLAIADNADDNGYAWPSIETIAHKSKMSERGARKCIAKLSDAGLLVVKIGGGRGKSNSYQITTNGMGGVTGYTNPEQNTLNNVHPLNSINPERRDINPEQNDTKPGTPVPPNSQEPSLEQSVPPLSPIDVLCEVVRRETAEDFASHRKSLKKPLTVEAAKRLVRKVTGHLDPDAIFDESIANGWQGVFPERSNLKSQTTNGGRNDRPKFDAAHREYTRLISAGAIDRGPDPSNPFARR